MDKCDSPRLYIFELGLCSLALLFCHKLASLVKFKSYFSSEMHFRDIFFCSLFEYWIPNPRWRKLKKIEELHEHFLSIWISAKNAYQGASKQYTSRTEKKLWKIRIYPNKAQVYYVFFYSYELFCSSLAQNFKFSYQY